MYTVGSRGGSWSEKGQALFSGVRSNVSCRGYSGCPGVKRFAFASSNNLATSQMLGPSFFSSLACGLNPVYYVRLEAHATKKVKGYLSKYLSSTDVVHALQVDLPTCCSSHSGGSCLTAGRRV